MLIPKNGVFISETKFPRGWYVARYDSEGFTSEPRWFRELWEARAYASQLRARAA